MDGRNIIRKLAGVAELHNEPLPGLPILELVGDQRVLIEGHRGVVGYTSQCVCVKVRYGKLAVCGKDLRLSHMSKEQLVITGRICEIKVSGGES